jgi:hypothetical protein
MVNILTLAETDRDGRLKANSVGVLTAAACCRRRRIRRP